MQPRDFKENMKYRYPEIIKAVADAARLYGVKQLAAEMCPPDKTFERYYGYLESKLTLTQSSSSHFLRADEMITIITITEDPTALRMMSDVIGYKLSPRKADFDGPADRMNTVMNYSAATAGTQQIIAEAAADGEIDDEEMHTIAASVRKDEERAAEVINAEQEKR